MASSADVQRSSQKKAAAADRARTAVLDRLARDEGDVFRQGMETHRRTMFTAYGQAMADGWLPQEITPDWLATETERWLANDYDDDYFRLVWDGEMQPGLTAAGQSPYVMTQPQRDVLIKSWPVPEKTPKKSSVDGEDSDDGSVDGDSTVRSLMPALDLAAGEVQDPIC